ncbi:MAG: hypothetical protein EBU54_10795 [Mycobacteriaceae bacterium]|nr:hypothetical protein [Mycobacteriaceae bacterium]
MAWPGTSDSTPAPTGTASYRHIRRTAGRAGPGSHCGGSHCGSDCGRATELKLQYLKVFLLIVVVVLLAMTLAAAGRLSRSLEKTVRSAVGALGAVAVGGRSV